MKRTETDGTKTGVQSTSSQTHSSVFSQWSQEKDLIGHKQLIPQGTSKNIIVNVKKHDSTAVLCGRWAEHSTSRIFDSNPKALLKG